MVAIDARVEDGHHLAAAVVPGRDRDIAADQRHALREHRPTQAVFIDRRDAGIRRRTLERAPVGHADDIGQVGETLDLLELHARQALRQLHAARLDAFALGQAAGQRRDLALRARIDLHAHDDADLAFRGSPCRKLGVTLFEGIGADGCGRQHAECEEDQSPAPGTPQHLLAPARRTGRFGRRFMAGRRSAVPAGRHARR